MSLISFSFQYNIKANGIDQKKLRKIEGNSTKVLTASDKNQSMASSKANDDMVMLEEPKQLRKLAKLLLNNEEPLMRSIKSEPERNKYLKECNETYEEMMSLVDKAEDMKKKYSSGQDQEKSSIAKDMVDYVKYFANMSMQNIRNCYLRLSCIRKIKGHYDVLQRELLHLDTSNLTNVRRLAKDVSLSKEFMWECANKQRSGSARTLSKGFSKMLKQEQIKFPDLIRRHQNKLGFHGEFETLEDAKKLKVYNNIIEESGRAKMPKLEAASGTLGVAVLVFTAGMMVWDIYTAEYKLEAILSNTLTALSEVGAFAVQVAVEAAVTTMFVEAGVLTVALAGFVAGMVAGFVFMAASGWLIDQIFGSGGKTVPNLDGCEFHTAQMPDGMAFAHQIAYLDS